MVRDTVRALWAEPRPSRAPDRVWRDWALVVVLVPWSVFEGFLREDLGWRPVAVTVGVVVALTLLWRRAHPLVAVAVAFGSLAAVDVATILAAGEPALPWSVACVLVLPYSLFRWGAGREAAIGLVIILGWLLVTFTADPVDGAAELAAGYGFFLFSAALGASIRYHANTRIRDIDQAKLREREQLARELHDTVRTTSRPSPSRPRPGAPSQHPTPTVPSRLSRSSRRRRRGHSTRCAPWSASFARARRQTSPRSRA